VKKKRMSSGWLYRLAAMMILCATCTVRAQQSSTAPTPSSAAPPASTPLPQSQQNAPALHLPAQQPSPSPALPPDMNLPALSPAPTQRSVPEGPNAQQAPNAQMLPPPITPLTQHVDTPEAPAPQITATMNSTVRPEHEEVHGITPNFLGFLGPFKRPVVPPLFDGSEARLQSLIKD
jgi:hypothetical protein